MYIPYGYEIFDSGLIHSSSTGHVPWNIKDIVYFSLMATLCLMTLIEMFLFTLAYSYAFIHVHRTAKRIGERILSIIIMLTLYVTRTGLLFVLISILALPPPIANLLRIPRFFVQSSQYAGVVLVGLMLLLPAFVSVWQLTTSRTIKHIQEETVVKPKVVIVMPVYNELPEVLFSAICSAVEGDYPKEHLHLFISFDNDGQTPLFLSVMENLGVPRFGDDYEYPPIVEVFFRGVEITVSRFPHGGKRLTQKKTFALISTIYGVYADEKKLFVLFIDSDIILTRSAILNFMWDMELNPKSPRNYLGMTGVIAITSSGEGRGFMSFMQDMEYVHGQLFGRAIESAAGAVICMPGAFTIFRYNDFVRVADEYFAEREVDNLFDFGRAHLGEDRYLTHLLMLRAPTSHRIQFCYGALCKTEAVFKMRSLLKQRRRWFMGFMTNESALLSDDRLWIKYPYLLVFSILRNIVNGTALFGYVVILGVVLGYSDWSRVWVILVSMTFGINYVLMITYGLRLHRHKTILYPALFFLAPLVSWFIFVYGIFTANERTWGGPRTEVVEKPKDIDEKDEHDNDDNDSNEGDELEIRNHGREDGYDTDDGELVPPPQPYLMGEVGNLSVTSLASFNTDSSKRNLSNKWWTSQEDLSKLGVVDYETRKAWVAHSKVKSDATDSQLLLPKASFSSQRSES